MPKKKETADAKPSIAGLAKNLNRLPADKKRVALESSAAVAAVSLRVSRDLIDAIPAAAKLLSADELRDWAELGRRIAMAGVQNGSRFFKNGAGWFAAIPESARPIAMRILTRQLVLASSTAYETLQLIPKLAEEIEDRVFFGRTLELAAELAGRSARHSVDLLKSTPAASKALERFGDDRETVSDSIFALAFDFANRTGGMTAELWALLPRALENISAADARRLFAKAGSMLEYGGSVTLNFIIGGNAVIAAARTSFEKWSSVVVSMAKYGNAPLIAFLKATPKFTAQMQTLRFPEGIAGAIDSVLGRVETIAQMDGEAALAAFRSSSFALRKVSSEQYGRWVENGIAQFGGESAKARRSYFAMETRESTNFLFEAERGLYLDAIRPVLRMYIEGLTGSEIEIEASTPGNSGSAIGDGRTISLPASIAEFDGDEANFKLYKVLAAHGAGQIEFGTFAKDTAELKAAFAEIIEYFDTTAEQRDAFSLAGYIEDIEKGERVGPNEPAPKKKKAKLPAGSDYRTVLKAFPEARLARKIFSAMENGRIDRMLRRTYRGLRKDLDLMQKLLSGQRPFIFDVPAHEVPFELLFQITLCGGASEDARRFYGQIVAEIENIVDRELGRADSTVADSIIATSRVYSLFQNIANENATEQPSDSDEEAGDENYEDAESGDTVSEDQVIRDPKPKERRNIQDLFNAWNNADDERKPDDISGPEAWAHSDLPEQPLETGDVAYSYDEWDRDLHDHRVGWSRVIEKHVRQGDRGFVELVRSRHRGVIASIRHQFQLMKPENLTRVNREIDGEDYDLNALVDLIIDRRSDGRQSENIYTKKLRKRRDVAVSILLDQSSSTARTITRNPAQPYTYPGRRIIEIEKEGLVLMSEALEAVGDVYSIQGFTSEGRRNVKFYVIKDFDEAYSSDVEARIGGITFQNNTRLGAAIRHAVAKLLRQENRTKLLIVLTDGRPYDHDYGDARYAREDVREALNEARTAGITPFCITIDRESEAELKDLYGDVGYTIIDDVLSLPEKMPNIYRRLTS